MLSSESRAREARRDTQVHLAPEQALKGLSRLYGLPWVTGENIPLESQRLFMRATLYSARGTYTGLFSSVRALFSYAETTESATLTFYKGLNDFMYIEGPAIDERWATDRFIELKQGEKRSIFRSTHREASGRVYLSPFTVSSHTGFFEAFNQYDKTVAETNPLFKRYISEGIEATILPFRIEEPQPQQITGARRERPCEAILEIDEEALVEIPPHYLRESGDARADDPQGGHLMDIFDPLIPDSGDTQRGPFPLYYPDESAVSEFLRSLFDHLLAAGVRLTARRRSM